MVTLKPRPEYTDEDMANVGRALMERLPDGYSYMNCPTEIVTDLQNTIADLDAEKGEMIQKLDAFSRMFTEATLRNGNLLNALHEARDLLIEKTQGSPARSPNHNARLVIDAALKPQA